MATGQVMPAPRCDSYYTHSIHTDSDYPTLSGEESVDVAIIGGGFTGINTAIELAQRGYSVALVEASRVGWGASGRNGGQVTGSLSGEGAMRQQMRRTLGAEVDDFIWQLRWRGHDIIRKRVARYDIDCDLKYGHLHAALKPAHMRELAANYEQALRRGMGDEVTLLDAAQMPDYLESNLYCGALYNRKNMHLHPLKLCLGEARAAASLGVKLFENSPVTNIVHGEQPQLVTAHGSITAQQVLLAGNAYHRLERRSLGGKIFPAAGGIVVTEPLGDEVAGLVNPKDLAVYDCRFVLDYYRLTADKRLLFGGGANYSGRPSRDIAAELRPALERTFPRLRGIAIDYQWSGMMGIVINRIPQLGRVTDNVWYAQGYSGHGIATSHIVAEVMGNALDGQLREFDVFAACRHIRVPGGEWLGNQLLVLGMWYYHLLERLR